MMRESFANARLLMIAAVCLLPLFGCQNQGMQNADRLVDATQALLDSFKSVVDAESARNATPKLEPAYEEWLAAFEAVVKHEKEHGETRGLKSKINKLMAEMARLQAELTAETDRVEKLKGLPIEYWNVVRLQSARVVVASLKAVEAAGQPLDAAIVGFVNDVAAIYEKYGPPKVIEIVVQDPTYDGMERVRARLAEIRGPGGELKEMPDPENPNEILMCVAPVEDFDAFVSKIDFATVVDQDKARGDLKIQCLTTNSITNSIAAGGEVHEAELDPEAERLRLEREAAERAEREREIEAQRERMEAVFREPDPNDPKYHEQLVELLADEQAHHHDTAVRALLALRPADIPDKATRGKIARGFKELAFTSAFEKREAAQGLVIWGGKHSVPILIQMLDQGRMHDNDAVWEALADVPTAEGAAAAARYLGDFFNKDKAAGCLRRMGTVAEEALIQAAPNGDAEVSLTAVTLLGEVGTKKSYPLLRKATRSANREIKEAAYASIRSIRSREESGKRSGKAAS